MTRDTDRPTLHYVNAAAAGSVRIRRRRRRYDTEIHVHHTWPQQQQRAVPGRTCTCRECTPHGTASGGDDRRLPRATAEARRRAAVRAATHGHHPRTGRARRCTTTDR